MGNINQEIINSKTELTDLKQQLRESNAMLIQNCIRMQIAAKEYQLTEHIKRLPITSGKNFYFLDLFSKFHSFCYDLFLMLYKFVLIGSSKWSNQH